MEGYASTLSEDNYSYSVIQKRCKSHGFSISIATIGNIIKEKGKNCHTLVSERKILPNTHIKKKHSSSNIAKMKSLLLKENSQTQKYVANTLN